MKGDKRIQGDGGVSQLDRCLRALSEKDRRLALYYLHEHGICDTEELARYVAAREAHQSPSSVAEEAVTQMQTELYHEHLPRLRDYGIVDYDERHEDVCLADPSPLFTVLLQVCKLVEDGS